MTDVAGIRCLRHAAASDAPGPTELLGLGRYGSRTVLAATSSERQLILRFRTESLHRRSLQVRADCVAKVFWSSSTRARAENDSRQAQIGSWDSPGDQRRRMKFYQSCHLSDVGATFATKSANYGLVQRSKKWVHGYGLIRPKRCRARSMNAARVIADAFSMP